MTVEPDTKAMQARIDEGGKSMTLIVTKGTLDWAYPPFILATTAAAMDMKVTMFFTFYGLGLLKKKLDLSVTTLGNSAMEMPMMGTHMKMPNMVSMIPGATALTSKMMKDLMAKKGVASIEELREAAQLSGVRMVACQMTLDMFEYTPDMLIDDVEYAGAATYLETAMSSDIDLYI